MDADILKQLNRIEKKLDKIMAEPPVNKTGWPVHAPTIEDELFLADKVHEGKGWEHFQGKAKKYRKNGRR